MADPSAPMQRRVPVGYRFCPTEEELVAHYLHHKLMGHDPSLYNTIPEIDVCKHEPWDLLAWASSEFPETVPDGSKCYFFSRRDYKYSNSTRSNRATPRGFWKATGKDRKIKERGTNKVIGIKKTLVFYEGRFPHGIRHNWVIHEYHMYPSEQRTHVLCMLMKKYEKKTKEKKKYEKKTKENSIDSEYELIDDERLFSSLMDFEHEKQANFYMVPEEEQYLPNINLMNIESSSQSNENMLDSSIQTSSSEPYEAEATDSTMIQPLSQSKEDTTPPELPPELRAIMEMPLDFDYELYYS